MAEIRDASVLTSRDELDHYQAKLTTALNKIEPSHKVLVVCHSDADGLTGGATTASYLEENKPGVQVGICHHLLNSEAFYEAAKGYDHIIVSDLWVDVNEGQQEYLRRLLAEGKNITIFDHHDKNFPLPENQEASKTSRGGRRIHSIPETIPNGLAPTDPEKGLGEFIYITPNRLGSPLDSALTGAVITYLMLAPHSKTGLEKMRKWLPISISGDYSRESWPKLLEESTGTPAAEVLETLGYALNAGHALQNPSEVVKALKDSESVEQLVEYPEIQALLGILRWARAEIQKVLPQLEGLPFLAHTHIARESLQAPELKHPLVSPDPSISNVYTDELRKSLKELVVIATQNRGESLRLNFRSSKLGELFNTRRLAQKFGGGGHHGASGANISLAKTTEEEALIQIRRLVDEENENFAQITKPEFERLDPNLAAYYEHKVREFIDAIPQGEEILLACHPDTDGISGAAIIKTFLAKQRPDVKITFCYAELDTEEFFEIAQNYNHIITTDLWIPTLKEDQKNLRTLLADGRKIAVFDHHDVHLKAFKPNKPQLADAPYDHELPETLANGLPGEICFISPRRLGATMENEQNYTATAVTYRILSRLEPSLAGEELAVLLSVLGDKADESWPALIEENEEDFDNKARLARVINLAKNLKPQHIQRIIELLTSGKSAEEILTEPQIYKLILMRRWIKKRAAEIAAEHTAEHGPGTSGLFFSYQITEGDEENFKDEVRKQGVEGLLNGDPCLCSGLSYAIARAIGGRQIAVVSQIAKQEDHYLIRYSFHTEGKGADHNAGYYAITVLNGGGKDMAGGGKQKAATLREAQRQVWVIRRYLSRIGNGTHP